MKGKLANEVVEERMYFLDQFLKGLTHQPYLACCTEIQIFFRPKHNVEKDFKCLEKVTTTQVFKFYMIKLPMLNFPDNVGESMIISYNE